MPHVFRSVKFELISKDEPLRAWLTADCSGGSTATARAAWLLRASLANSQLKRGHRRAAAALAGTRDERSAASDEHCRKSGEEAEAAAKIRCADQTGADVTS